MYFIVFHTMGRVSDSLEISELASGKHANNCKQMWKILGVPRNMIHKWLVFNICFVTGSYTLYLDDIDRDVAGIMEHGTSGNHAQLAAGLSHLSVNSARYAMMI